MLASMQLRKSDGTFITTFPILGVSDTSPYVIKHIDGLDPVAASVSTSTYAPIDGGVVQGSRLDNRNIVITFGYRPDYTTVDPGQKLRRDLYRYFSPKRNIRLTFLNTDGRPVQIDGTVETHETPIFSKDPEAQVSILCPDPNFSATASITQNGVTGTPLTLSSVGSAQSGFVFDITTPRVLAGIAVQTGEYSELNYSRSLLVNDRVRISTVRGGKTVYLFRDGQSINDLDRIAGGSMSIGFDDFSPIFNARVSGDHALPYTLTYTPRYLGI